MPRRKLSCEQLRSATTTSALLKLAEWLAQAGCTHVAMEATGVYWKPVWHVLEGGFELVLANAAHITEHSWLPLEIGPCGPP
jgi:transposase